MFPWLLLILSFAPTCFALECYVCTSQDKNNEKCTETIKTCDPSETRCLTEVRWGTTEEGEPCGGSMPYEFVQYRNQSKNFLNLHGTPYWAASGEKQYYISKHCSTEENCLNQTLRYEDRCDRIWYNDWECVECCTGDRCNYYVTLGAGLLRPSAWTCIAALAVGLLACVRVS